jgi:ribosomal protein L11 methyltransferase
MNYIKVVIATPHPSVREMLIAILAEEGYDGFEETEDELFAYTSEQLFDEQLLRDLAGQHPITLNFVPVPAQNWNETWEQNFAPVIIEGVCTVRADFHRLNVTTPHDIIINPKMSFGTGHHATTQMMMEEMHTLSFAGKTVLDFGTGTGILAIYAEKLGAASVLAIDHDENCRINAAENVENNSCKRIIVRQALLEDTRGVWDIILANINKNILLQYMSQLADRLPVAGHLLLSGILQEDQQALLQAAQEHGLVAQHQRHKDKWLLIHLTKAQ